MSHIITQYQANKDRKRLKCSNLSSLDGVCYTYVTGNEALVHDSWFMAHMNMTQQGKHRTLNINTKFVATYWGSLQWKSLHLLKRTTVSCPKCSQLSAVSSLLQDGEERIYMNKSLRWKCVYLHDNYERMRQLQNNFELAAGC